MVGGAGLTFLVHLQRDRQPYPRIRGSIGTLRLPCRLRNGGLDRFDLFWAETSGGSLVLWPAEARANGAL